MRYHYDMTERIPEPDGLGLGPPYYKVTLHAELRAMEGYLELAGAVGDISVDANGTDDADEVQATGQAAPGELREGTTLTNETFWNTWDHWQAGETVQSVSEVIAELPISEEDWDTLMAYEGEFIGVSVYALRGEWEHDQEFLRTRYNGLTPELLQILIKIQDAFTEIVERDGERGDLGPVRHPYDTELRFGWFDPQEEELGWHADHPDDGPTVRYVVSYGGERLNTMFSHSPLNKSQMRYGIPLIQQANVAINPVSHPNGSVVRFMSHYSLHGTPRGAGKRLFFSSSLTPERPLSPDTEGPHTT